tara:strand:+ start:158 stop:403 length:246 start_codon:yes stop_codon:yes gene_type:complete
MKKLLTLVFSLIIITSVSAKDTKKISTDFCEDAIKNGRVLGFSGSSDSYNIRFILEHSDKLYRYTVNKNWTECYSIDEKHN